MPLPKHRLLCSLCRAEKPIVSLINYGPDRWPLGVPPGLNVLEPLCAECQKLLTPEEKEEQR